MVSQCSRCGRWSYGAWYPRSVKTDANGRSIPWTPAQYDEYTGPQFCSEDCRDAAEVAA